MSSVTPQEKIKATDCQVLYETEGIKDTMSSVTPQEKIKATDCQVLYETEGIKDTMSSVTPQEKIKATDCQVLYETEGIKDTVCQVSPHKRRSKPLTAKCYMRQRGSKRANLTLGRFQLHYFMDNSFLVHHSTDRIVCATAFVTPVVEHCLE